eukprot:snap_masked-scaffold_21-processed-gene-2.6-mRNA-1 protein AED:0.02 eAED:0.02 QI:0/-1/0/1/-1/1/1/0/395
MKTTTSLISLLSLHLSSTNAEAFFKETFSNGDLSNWVESGVKDDLGKFELSASKNWNVDETAEVGLRVPDDAKFYAISSRLETPFSNADKDLVVQFSVKNENMKSSGFCGGGYLKLLPEGVDLENFGGDTDYEIMFGPDICGSTSRVHLIFNYKGENLLKTDDIKLNYKDKNELTHLYTLIVRPDNTYEVFVDEESRASGELTEEWDFPSKEIPDAEDKKPEDWVDDEMMDDPEDEKPEGYDDIPKKIPDPEAEKPDDWDDEDDGEWEPPLIKNPEYKGVWKPKKIKNPDYKGKWIQKKLPNPDYDDKVYLRKNIGAVGFELWIVNSGSIFDNIYVGDSLDEARDMAKKTYGVIKETEEEVRDAYKEKKKAEEEAAKAVEEEQDEEEEEEEKTEL